MIGYLIFSIGDLNLFGDSNILGRFGLDILYVFYGVLKGAADENFLILLYSCGL
jgi:hypothetical protein